LLLAKMRKPKRKPKKTKKSILGEMIKRNGTTDLDLMGFTIPGPFHSPISRKWQKAGRVDYAGQFVKNPSDLADMFSVFRSPNVEHFHRVYVDDAGKILAHEALSSGLNTVTVPFSKVDHSQSDYGFEKVYAEGIWRVNKQDAPAGRFRVLFITQPSLAARSDLPAGILRVTAHYIKNVPGFLGHIILDHNNFNLLTDSGETEIIEKRWQIHRIAGLRRRGPRLFGA
jgi:hypothetical protein